MTTEATIREQKMSAALRIVGVSDTFEVKTQPGMTLAGRGIRRIYGDVYSVTDAAMSRLQKTYTVATDF